MARVTELQSILGGGAAPAATPAATTSTQDFSAMLRAASAGAATATGAAGPVAPVTATGNGVGARMVALAQAEVGQAEQPPGSNDSARIATYQENLIASESRIRDVDMAAEMVDFSKNQILQQAGTSMLAQANQAPQGILSLLRG